MTNDNQPVRPRFRRRLDRAMRASLGALVALAWALSVAGCTRSPKSPPASPPDAPRRGSLLRVEQCAKAPVPEPVCTGSTDHDTEAHTHGTRITRGPGPAPIDVAADNRYTATEDTFSVDR